MPRTVAQFATGLIIPAGQVATLSDAHWALTPCDRLTYGYHLNFGTLVPRSSRTGRTRW
jgi:hypothetical protein